MKHILVILLSALLLLSSSFNVAWGTTTTTTTTSTSYDTSGITQAIMSFFSKIISASSALSLKNIKPLQWVHDVSNWFQGTTGVTLSQAWNGIKKIIIWFVGNGIRIIHWIVSLVHPQ